MKSFEIIDTFGDTVVVEPELGLYTAYDFMENKMPNLGIQLYSYDEDGFREPYATLTVNLGEFIGAKNCAYIDTNNNSFTAQLLEKGFCSDTGLTKQSGFYTYPLWKFDEEFLKSIDPDGLYDVYSKKYDEYMNEGPQLPLSDREGDVITDVMAELGLEDAKINFDSDGLTVWVDDFVYSGEEVYRYLLSEVCEYNKDGSVKGLELDLCNDFYDLCEHNGVDFHDYNKPEVSHDVEYVITMSSGAGTIEDFMTCASKSEAVETCKYYDWEFVDENEFVWELNIEEREVTLEDKLASATERSKETLDEVDSLDDLEKDFD